MQALLFEMQPRDGHEDHYFRHAATLRPLLIQNDGLIFIERFKSLSRPSVILSHSLWRDEASIAQWRTDREHHKSQSAGRYKHFEDYRIRISHALYYFEPNVEQKEWSKDGAYNNSASTDDRFLTIIRSNEKPVTNGGDVFESVTELSSYLSVDEFASEDDGRTRIACLRNDTTILSALFCRVSRDYGMYDRLEAPQYYEPIEQQE